MSVPNGARCTQPGCSGSIQDGYCDVCGTPAGAAPVTATGDNGAGDSPSSASKITSSNRLASAPIGTARAGGTRATRSIGTGSTRLRGARLGAGLTFVPPVPAIDPEKAIMKDPQVPEDRRYCPSCGTAVGRSREGRPGRLEGFCPKCRNPFSFTPKLQAGDLVGGQYEVAGCLAHGGMGWIYLARDTCVGRPVGGAEGAAQLRGRRRVRRRRGGAAVPRQGRAPTDRRDLQLRHRTTAPATS